MSSALTRRLQLQQVDDALAKWRTADLPRVPPSGWLRAIRGSLRMGAGAVAQRMGIGDRAVRKLEAAEREGAITLATLRRAALATDCELVYALVPRKSLHDMLMDRARQLAEAELAPVARSMELESQGLGAELHRRQIELIAELMVQQGRPLWRP